MAICVLENIRICDMLAAVKIGEKTGIALAIGRSGFAVDAGLVPVERGTGGETKGIGSKRKRRGAINCETKPMDPDKNRAMRALTENGLHRQLDIFCIGFVWLRSGVRGTFFREQHVIFDKFDG